ncbi:MAG: proline--tRNA ligase, partial [Actinobacteria bacterium]|nr:proline--tRNA ligase [Actinomycetota bacterium]
KVERIVREEMDGAGAQEVRMPAIVPSEPWKVTGRWQAYAQEQLMFTLRDRSGRELGLGPTHEEVVTPLVAQEYESYRDLPVNLYQIQWKYRDEARPRSGLLRGREFLMKDAYSFDRDAEGMRVSYDKMVEAYQAIFDRCGLTYRVVEADPGLIGGDVNHEFMAPAEVGEDLFVECTSCDYAANLEAAKTASPEDFSGEPEPLAEVHTPERATIREVVDLLGVPAERMLKTMAYEIGEQLAVILVAGDREVNEGKLRRAFAPAEVRMLEDEDFARHGLVKGYVGPQGLTGVTVVADHRVRGGGNWVTGANKSDYHVTGANRGRDFDVDRWEDLATVHEGDPCPRCASPMRVGKSIEVGHTFQLGTKYSDPLKATFVDEDGIERPFLMGCYGIGMTRIVSAVAEQHHDGAGLAWPKVVAPYEVVVIVANRDHEGAASEGERIYRELAERGVEVVIDDRDETAGVKFADADLIGYPVQVVVGKRGVEAGTVDLKLRATGERSAAELGRAVDAAVELLEGAP